MSTSPLRLVLGCGFMLGVCGCDMSPQGPSYADLVVIYNAELESLDRLESKRDQVLGQIEVLTRPSKTDQAADMLKGMLETAGELKRRHGDLLPGDPDDPLQRALDSADEAELIASKVLDAVTQPSEEETSASQEELIALRVKLADLEKQIAAQEERVERARKNRDAAEAQR